MAIDFPNSPSTNDTYTVNGRTYTWNGEKWLRTKPELTSVVPTLTISSDLTVDTDTLHVDATNNRVGIGTSSPSKELDVHGASNPEVRILSTDASDPALVFGDSVDGARGSIYYDTSDDRLIFRGYDNANRMTIDSSGNVGIGTTSPARGPLHLHTPSTAATELHLTNTESGSTSGDGFTLFYDDATNGAGLWMREAGPLRFATNNSEKMRILSDGKVGIGTMTPSAELEVASTSPQVTFTDTDGVASGAISSMLHFDHASGTAGQVGFGTTAGNMISWSIGGNYYSGSQYASGNHYFRAGGSDKMALLSNGNFGIGTTTPGYKLDVNGALAIGNTSQIFTNWGSGSDIDGLLPGSTFGGVMYTNTSGHFAIGIRNNDTADSFSIVSGGSNSGGYTSNTTFDLLVANFRGDGNGSIAGTWTTSASDERLKTVTGTITEPLTKISALEGFYFTWNDVASELGLPDADVVQVGVSAQSVLSVMPEAVRTAPISQGKAYETEYYTVMYERLVPLLIEGVKAQQTQIDALTAQNAALTTRIEALEAN